MTWAFVIVGKTEAVMADLNGCLGEIDEVYWGRLWHRHPADETLAGSQCHLFVHLALEKYRMERVLRENVFDVGD